MTPLGGVLSFGGEISTAEEGVVAISRQDMKEIRRERSHSAAVKEQSLYVRNSILFPGLLKLDCLCLWLSTRLG